VSSLGTSFANHFISDKDTPAAWGGFPSGRAEAAQQLDGADPASSGKGLSSSILRAGRAAHLEAVRRKLRPHRWGSRMVIRQM